MQLHRHTIHLFEQKKNKIQSFSFIMLKLFHIHSVVAFLVLMWIKRKRIIKWEKEKDTGDVPFVYLIFFSLSSFFRNCTKNKCHKEKRESPKVTPLVNSVNWTKSTHTHKEKSFFARTLIANWLNVCSCYSICEVRKKIVKDGLIGRLAYICITVKAHINPFVNNISICIWRFVLSVCVCVFFVFVASFLVRFGWLAYHRFSISLSIRIRHADSKYICIPVKHCTNNNRFFFILV